MICRPYIIDFPNRQPRQNAVGAIYQIARLDKTRLPAGDMVCRPYTIRRRAYMPGPGTGSMLPSATASSHSACLAAKYSSMLSSPYQTRSSPSQE